MAQAIHSGQELDAICGLNEVGLLDRFFHFLQKVGVLSLAEEFKVPDIQRVLIAGERADDQLAPGRHPLQGKKPAWSLGGQILNRPTAAIVAHQRMARLQQVPGHRLVRDP